MLDGYTRRELRSTVEATLNVLAAHDWQYQRSTVSIPKEMGPPHYISFSCGSAQEGLRQPSTEHSHDGGACVDSRDVTARMISVGLSSVQTHFLAFNSVLLVENDPSDVTANLWIDVRKVTLRPNSEEELSCTHVNLWFELLERNLESQMREDPDVRKRALRKIFGLVKDLGEALAPSRIWFKYDDDDLPDECHALQLIDVVPLPELNAPTLAALVARLKTKLTHVSLLPNWGICISVLDELVPIECLEENQRSLVNGRLDDAAHLLGLPLGEQPRYADRESVFL